jgi:hypothetical protein
MIHKKRRQNYTTLLIAGRGGDDCSEKIAGEMGKWDLTRKIEKKKKKKKKKKKSKPLANSNKERRRSRLIPNRLCQN